MYVSRRYLRGKYLRRKKKNKEKKKKKVAKRRRKGEGQGKKEERMENRGEKLCEFRERRKESVKQRAAVVYESLETGGDRGGCIYVGYQSDNSITVDDNAMYALTTVIVVAFVNRAT